jgi:D-alanyl-lipoteichoic acid acyltransferase DltB (MBOAT superfamily)
VRQLVGVRMLFNSYIFLFAFLPATYVGYFGLTRFAPHLAKPWLAAASFVFYGAWDIRFVPILAGSIVVNFMIGARIARALAGGQHAAARRVLALGIVANLALLGWFKYANFFVQTAGAIAGTVWELGAIVLPLGISFFTFTQIAYLADAAQGRAREYDPIDYCLFVTYFPHLIAGPILHHAEMMPQFGRPAAQRRDAGLLDIGLAIFALGLFKKVGLADRIAPYANAVFDAAARGMALSGPEAWSGATAYGLQLYFDFSGYSDMAIGLSLMFGIRLPLNFASPYKATNIVEFWRHWHMTLSRFLRDYLYIPLGGNRHGAARRYLNLTITMLLGGLWHGAGWTYLIWGALHGAYLMVAHAWAALVGPTRLARALHTTPGRWAARMLTFAAVTVAWVFFRADNVTTATSMLSAMFGVGPAGAGEAGPTLARLFPNVTDVNWRSGLMTIAGLLGIAWFAPNIAQIFRAWEPALGVTPESAPPSRLAWKPGRVTTLVAGLALAASVLMMTRTSQFLYFQF